MIKIEKFGQYFKDENALRIGSKTAKEFAIHPKKTLIEKDQF